jgi:hypothetical protein
MEFGGHEILMMFFIRKTVVVKDEIPIEKLWQIGQLT